jgi:hypothetical protein
MKHFVDSPCPPLEASVCRRLATEFRFSKLADENEAHEKNGHAETLPTDHSFHDCAHHAVQQK